MTRVRLLKVMVQPVVVIDDGDTLTEHVVAPVVVPAAEWDAFVDHGFTDGLAELEQRVSAPQPNDDEHADPAEQPGGGAS
jgi:hypothetical protein